MLRLELVLEGVLLRTVILPVRALLMLLILGLREMRVVVQVLVESWLCELLPILCWLTPVWCPWGISWIQLCTEIPPSLLGDSTDFVAWRLVDSSSGGLGANRRFLNSALRAFINRK